MEIIMLVTGLAVGAILGFLIAKMSSKNSDGANALLKESVTKLETENAKLKETEIDLNKKLAGINTTNQNLEQRMKEKQEEIETVQKKLTAEFENLANKIFEEKSSRFTQQNKDNIDQILKPLGDKIKSFEEKVERVYNEDTKERASLVQQIKNLHDLNQQMSKDANNLTNALKGESKTQGNWGEFILDNILEKSGLVKGREYETQTTFTGEEGKRQKPDVIINLPEDRHIIIDSKVSLTAYEEFCSAEDESSRKAALNNHISSLRKHVKELSDKNYQNIHNLSSMDFVIMFVPIEPAMAIASQADINIWTEAFEKNIVIVSPSILLATLRTIANIWKQEKQNRYAIEIATESGKLYDKFVGFMDDLILIGKKIDESKVYYTESMKKLHDGSGNIIKRIENLKTLGAKATKSIGQNLLDKASDE
ncbi:MAG: DNA recombination protein RmuC [Ignavibacteriae bacterium]|nr:DNA recombination protein RmuC [Ignavibacteriota bacterium]